MVMINDKLEINLARSNFEQHMSGDSPIQWWEMVNFSDFQYNRRCSFCCSVMIQ